MSTASQRGKPRPASERFSDHRPPPPPKVARMTLLAPDTLTPSWRKARVGLGEFRKPRC